MIRRSTAIAIATILLSLLVHLLGLSFTTPGQSERPAEETASDVVALGNAFEDVAEALSEPVSPEPAPIPDPPVEKTPDPDLADVPTSEALVASTDPQQVFAPGTDSANVPQPDTTGPSEPEDSTTPEPQTVDPSGGDAGAATEAAVTPPVEPGTVAQAPVGALDAGTETVEDVAALPEPRQSVALAPQPPAAPVPPITPAPLPSAVPVIPLVQEMVDPEIPELTVEPVAEDPETANTENVSDGSELAVAVSPRPRLATRRPSTEPLGQNDGSAEFSELVAPPLIESPLTAYQRDRSDPTVRPNRAARSSGLGFLDSRSSGNSDATNYAGRVLVHLNRAPLVPVSGRGFARVFFEINPDGSLAWVNVVDSTGSPAIERAAKERVRSAAPFPRPPQGASRKLVFVYQIN